MNDRDRFDKFTERARKALNFAGEEAQRFNHTYIGTEHLLLGLIREDEGVAAQVLSNIGVELHKVRATVEFIIGRGDRIILPEIGLTPRAKKVIELAVDEARRLNHHYVGTEHLLLGLVREGEGIAAGVLESLGVNLEKARTQTIQVLSQASSPEHHSDASQASPKDRFDKFTERARKVVNLAQEEAQRFNHNYIGSEHLLLGLVREGDGVAAQVLSNLGVELHKVRSAVEFIIGRGDRIVLGEIGLTPRAKKVIELAGDEARRLNYHYIGTGHLLLGLVREGEGIAAGILESLNVNLEKVRTQTIQALGQSSEIESSPSSLQETEKALGAVLDEKEAAIQHQEYELAAELRDREVMLRDRIARLETDPRKEQESEKPGTEKKDDARLSVTPAPPVAPQQEVETATAPAVVEVVSPAIASTSRTRAFISYSHKDKKHLERLHVHLKHYERMGALDVWDDTKIGIGAKWLDEIKAAMRSAKVAILLISADFLASDFVAEKELPQLLAAARDEGAVIIPVILKPCAFEVSEIGQFQAVENARPLIHMSAGKREEVWAKVARLVKEALKTVEAQARPDSTAS